MKRKSIFIVGTDTGVGKTVVACLLARGLVERGLAVNVLKPYAAGSWQDTRALKSAARSRAPLQDITPAFVTPPVAPGAVYLNKPAEARKIFTRVAQHLKRLSARADYLIVEGIGGLLVPLGGGRTALDLLKVAPCPVWIVARPGLGTLNHTLLTRDVLKRHKVTIERIILSGYTGQGVAERTNPAVLERLTGLPVTCLAVVKRAAARQKAARLLARLFLEGAR